ncbi:MAG: hypothetical protein CLLPBCKN_001051 [Chroococcidiopsis cubana SAG 39.79]|nr:hypothetical protein [Chroococcidiopsis cubana SAG 39.79]
MRELESLSIIKNLKVNVATKVLGDDVILLLPTLAQLKFEQRNYNYSSNPITAINLKSFPDYNYNLIKISLENYLKQLLDNQNSQPEYFCFGREPGPGDRNLLEILDRCYQNSLVIRDPYEEGWRSF